MRMPYPFKKCLFIVLAMAVFASAYATESPDLESVLQAFQDSFNWTNHVAMEVSSVERGQSAPEQRFVSDLRIYYDDAGELRSRGSRRYEDSSGALLLNSDGSPELHLECQSMFSRQSGKEFFYDYGKHPEKEMGQLDVWEAGEEHLEKTLRSAMNGGALFGYVFPFMTQRLPDLLSSENTTMREEGEGEYSYYLLEAKMPEGMIRVWLDPARDYAMQKCVLVKEAGKDLNFQGEIFEFENSFFDPPLAVLKSITEIYFSKYEESQGIHIPHQASLVTRQELEGGEVFENTTTSSLSNIQLNPDPASWDSFEFSVPSGTSAKLFTKEGAVLTGFQWHDGELIADAEGGNTPQEMKEHLAQLNERADLPEEKTSHRQQLQLDRESEEKRTEDFSFLQLVLALGGILVLVAQWIIYRMMKKKNKEN